MPCSWSTLGAWWFLRGPYKVPRVWYGYHSSSRGSSCHIITLGFSAKDSSDFLQVPWGKGEHRAEACSGQYGKLPSTTPDALPRWCAELSTLLHWASAGLRRAWCTRNCTKIYCEIKFCIPFLSTFLIFLDIFFCFFWPFSWPFWASFTSHACRDSLERWEFRGPDAPSLAQAILCQTPPKILGTIMLLHQTYSA